MIESGLDTREQGKERFLGLADRLARSRDPEEQNFEAGATAPIPRNAAKPETPSAGNDGR